MTGDHTGHRVAAEIGPKAIIGVVRLDHRLDRQQTLKIAANSNAPLRRPAVGCAASKTRIHLWRISTSQTPPQIVRDKYYVVIEGHFFKMSRKLRMKQRTLLERMRERIFL
jgi:hypothetical protein